MSLSRRSAHGGRSGRKRHVGRVVDSGRHPEVRGRVGAANYAATASPSRISAAGIVVEGNTEAGGGVGVDNGDELCHVEALAAAATAFVGLESFLAMAATRDPFTDNETFAALSAPALR